MVTAFVLCGVAPGAERSVLQKLRRISQEAHLIYGQYDLIAKISVDRCEDLEAFISKLRNIKEIQNTHTWITMD
ncbi:MAG: Lrp/AsnC ligand binding domain-containing protein [Theionarchaea archaeon]|nr:Lrp/AsnC ligand binding domain-containing protein [Theionarchaea archaeon]MBU7021221.1 Lrp/AsnC ligand binding domain-containing protein [Theionarchaea archaeon]MBU7035718.1 Lrp/AsnC ligand binding domain-containing protein [Theionarchaea archaeon]MBU7039713.1 Lrp/AsnC ligand binding domain-containing protein [Theionarchaea archaeon]